TRNVIDACIDLKVKDLYILALLVLSLMEFMELLMGMKHCHIQPSIFGPSDKLLVPSLVSAARAGHVRYEVRAA
ncbi:3beta-hydroxysteroid-4alpha-carboxylate 3-dehydrogenase, partial [Sarracenia purpurea var. burkii]